MFDAVLDQIVNYGLVGNDALQKQAANQAGVQAADERDPELQRAFREIGQRLQVTYSMIQRVGAVADRISGPVPKEVGKTEGIPNAVPTIMAKINIAHNALVQMNSELSSHLERLEALV